MYIEENLNGIIYLPDGREIKFTEHEIIDNSVSISSQCMPDTSFSLGGVYSAQLSMTIRLESDGLNSYNVIGSKVKIYTKYDNEEDFILRGVFWITSASRYKDIYTLSGSDVITWLDTGIYNSSDDCQNYIYSYLRNQGSNTLNSCVNNIIQSINEILEETGIERLFFERNDENTVNNNPMEDNEYGQYYPGYNLPDTARTGENETKSPRDYASWAAATACGFIDVTYTPKENGNPMMYEGNPVDCAIKIGQFETEPSCEIYYNEIENDSLDIADFNIRKILVAYGINYIDKNNIDSYNWGYVCNEKQNAELNIELSDNPFVRSYLFNYDIKNENKYSAMLIIETLYVALANIKIRPFSLKCHAKNRFRLGQCIKIQNYDGNKYESTITKIVWNFRGGYELGCAGEDNRILYNTARRTPSVKAKEQAITRFNYENAKNHIQFNNLQTQINDNSSDANDRMDSLQTQISENQGYIEKLQGDINNLQTQINGLWDSIHDLESSI